MTERSSNTGQPVKRKFLMGCSVIAVILFVIVVTPLLIYLSLVGLGAMLIVADPIQPVDAVVILSGDDGDRLGMAADMLARGYVRNLVITNTDHIVNLRLAREAEDLGFERDRIFITNLQVDSTLDEAQAVRDLAQTQGWSALMVVTDPPHSFRTRLIFRWELRGSNVAISVRPVVGHWFRSPTWFYDREGWRYVFLEIGKLFNYLLFHT
ncbi:MAG: YdcF family protein [Brevefilum sp.]|nr:YdcF family protein [Brevefilum sp.]